MSILNTLFGGAAATPAPQSQPVQSSLAPTANPQGTTQQTAANPPANVDSNTFVPNSNTPLSDGSRNGMPNDNTSNHPANPLSNFADLWNTPEPTNKTPVADPTRISFGLDPAKLSEQIGKMDFRGAFDPAMIQKAQGGDAAALSALLNRASQVGFEKAITASTQMVEQSVNRALGAMQDRIPSTITNQLTASQIRADNPLMNDPAAGPVLDAIATQLRTKNPGKSADEIKGMVNTFLDGLTNAHATATGKTVSSPDQNSNRRPGPMARQDTDWSMFFNGN